MINLVVLISGGGSNLQSIIDSVNRGHVDATIAAVVSDQADAFGLERARAHGISREILESKNFSSGDEYDAHLITLLEKHNPDLIVLAGFMRILGKSLTEKYRGKIMNIHPSLLPKFKGLNTHQRAIDAGDCYHGATVHFVTPELDDGPVIIQARVPINKFDDADALQKKVLEQEHIIYPRAIQAFAQGRISFHNPRLQHD